MTAAWPVVNDPSRKFMLVAAAASSCAVELAIMVAALAWYVLADLASRVSHRGIDNYGDTSMPVFGPQIEAFQGHSKWPWTITRRQVVNNLHELARAVAFSFLPFILLCVDAPSFVSSSHSASSSLMKQFHLWGHCTKSWLLLIVVALQDVGMLLSQTKRGPRPSPVHNNYCFVSGIWNRILNEYGGVQGPGDGDVLSAGGEAEIVE